MSADPQTIRIALTGDVMLGRLVDEFIIRNQSFPPASLWGDVLPLLSSSDLCFMNLECVISTKGEKWKPEVKPFHFRAHPRAIEFLQAAEVDGVTLANNHVLDYGPEALRECLDLLQRSGIRSAGAGLLRQCLAPMVFPSAIGDIGVLALTDNEPSWEATPSRLGVNYVRLTPKGMVSSYQARIEKVLKEMRQTCQFIIVSAHVGPNWGAPSVAIQALAHQLVEWGADVLWGHSNHTPQGIAVFKGKVMLYSTGDFVDDYAVDPLERNDLSFLFVIEVEVTTRNIARVILYPTAIEKFRVRRARGEEITFLQNTMSRKCLAFNTRVQFHHDQGTIAVT